MTLLPRTNMCNNDLADPITCFSRTMKVPNTRQNGWQQSYMALKASLPL